MSKNAHCSYCGAAFSRDQPWPRSCGGCGTTSFVNPTPVGVLLLPIDDGLLVVRRAIEPKRGQLALPGGFLDLEETWQEGVARELLEETGIRIGADVVREFAVRSAPGGLLLVFGEAPGITLRELPTFMPNPEVSELRIIGAPEPLAFPLHEEVVQRWFQRQRAG